MGLFTLIAIAWGFIGMETRLGNRNELGLVADPVVRATALSWQGCRTIQTLHSHPSLTAGQKDPFTHLTMVQPLIDPKTTDLATQLGERWAQRSNMYLALGGTVGPQLMLDPETQVHWANGLTTASTTSVVLCETATGFRLWGQIENALLYAALTDVGLGHFDRARGHLKRAAELSGDQIAFIYDEGQMVVPLSLVVQQKEAFTDWTLALLNQDVLPLEVGGLQDLFFNLLSSSTGRSVEDLTAGSRVLDASPDPAPQ